MQGIVTRSTMPLKYTEEQHLTSISNHNCRRNLPDDNECGETPLARSCDRNRTYQKRSTVQHAQDMMILSPTSLCCTFVKYGCSCWRLSTHIMSWSVYCPTRDCSMAVTRSRIFTWLWQLSCLTGLWKHLTTLWRSRPLHSRICMILTEFVSVKFSCMRHDCVNKILHSSSKLVGRNRSDFGENGQFWLNRYI